MATAERDLGSMRATTQSGVGALPAVLLWPIVSLLITGAWHFMIEAIWPDLRNVFVPAVLAPLVLAYGAWAGYRAVTVTGSYVIAIVAGAIVGVLPFTLELVGFGLILGRGFDAGLLGAIFGFSMVLFGALLGGGFALSRRVEP